MSYYNKCSLSS